MSDNEAIGELQDKKNLVYNTKMIFFDSPDSKL